MRSSSVLPKVWKAGRTLVLVIALILIQTVIALSSQFHVTTAGSSAGNGSVGSPWNLTTALNQPSAVRPGDTIWVHGGTYNGTYTPRLNGTASQPIIVRAYNNERVTIDGGNSDGNPIFYVASTYTWFWGLEIMSSQTTKIALISQPNNSWPIDIPMGEGVVIYQNGNGGTGCKFINLIVHDTRQGFSSWKDAVGAEVYGCVVYDNGWLGPDQTHGHNFYVQNVDGTKIFSDNYVLRAYSHGIQSYGSDAAYANNLQFEGNVVVNNVGRGFLLGTGNAALNPVFKDNVVYRDEATCGTTLFIMNYGTTAGTQNAVVTGNYFLGGLLTFNYNTNMTFNGNTLYNSSTGGDAPSMSGNTVLSSKPSTNSVLLRRNKYDPRRANITILNWQGLDYVDVNVSSVLQNGDTFEVRDAQNYFATPVISGTYTGQSLHLPLVGLSIPAKVGNDPRTVSHTQKDLGTFVLVGYGSGQAPSATVSGSLSASPTSLPAGGGTVTLTWSSVNATSASINQGVGTVATNGSTTVQVTGSRTFTLTLNGTGGPVTSQASVSVATSPTSLSAVTLQSPADGTITLQTTISLSWNAVANATAYEVQVANDQAFSDVFYSNTSVSATNQTVSNLVVGSAYYWRVRAKNATVTGAYSSIRTFSTTVSKTSALFPIDLRGTPPEASAISIFASKPGDVDSVYVTMWVYDADGANEGMLRINDRDSIPLFSSMASSTHDQAVTAFTMGMSSAAWNNGENTITIEHLATAGFRVDSISVSLVKGSTPTKPAGTLAPDFTLVPNYPNPFNPSTTISFTLGSTSKALLEVYNLLGQKVATLVDDVRPAGSYSVRFNAAGLPSGVYFYQLSTDNGFAQRRTMLLLK
jgi:hypothetical protein